MGRPRHVFEEQTQIRITREAYSAVRKAAQIRRMTAPAYLSMIALQSAQAEIVADARRTIADAEARLAAASQGATAGGTGHVH